MDIPNWLIYAVAFAWGAIWGSFLNVCIYRIPLGLSVVRPASRCPACGTEIKPWHNVPILSWPLLRGRCAACKAPFSPRYALVELLTAVLAVAVMARALHFADLTGGVASVALPFLFQFTFVAALLVVTFIDIDHMIIPNGITLPGVVFGVVAALVTHPETGVLWWHSLLGAAVGGGFLLLLVVGYTLLTGREGLGLGDFKLMAMVGAFLGIQALPFVLFASALQGLVYAVVAYLTGGAEAHRAQLAQADAREEARANGETGDSPAGADPEPPEDGDDDGEEPGGLRTMPIPFGPFIALAAVEWLFFGREALDWFLEVAL